MALNERCVAGIDACLVAAIIQAVIEVYQALVAADRRGIALYQPRRRDHQSSSKDRQRQDPPHQFRNVCAKHWSTPLVVSKADEQWERSLQKLGGKDG